MKFLIANALSFACLAAMFAAAIFLYADLPETLPVQYRLDGVAQNYLPKTVAVLLLPLIYAAAVALTNLLIHYSPEKFSMPNSRRAMDIILFGAGLLMLASHVGIMRGAGDSELFLQYFSVGLAFFLLVTGNVIGKTERNFFIGIRLPWTIASMENWRATHRFTGKLMVASGLLLLVASYFESSTGTILILGFNWAVLSVAYSFLYYLRNERAN